MGGLRSFRKEESSTWDVCDITTESIGMRRYVSSIVDRYEVCLAWESVYCAGVVDEHGLALKFAIYVNQQTIATCHCPFRRNMVFSCLLRLGWVPPTREDHAPIQYQKERVFFEQIVVRGCDLG